MQLRCVLVGLAPWLFACEDAVAGVVEVFPVAYWPPSFGKQAWVRANWVVWQRDRPSSMGGDAIQAKDISRLDNPIFDVAPYAANTVGVLLTPQYLLRGVANGFPGGSPVIARPLEKLQLGESADVFVCDFGQAVGATNQYVIIKTDFHEDARFYKKYLAKPTAELGNTSLDSLKPIAAYRRETYVSRAEAASESYFVWQDFESDTMQTWKIYAKRLEELLVPGAESMVLDTNVFLQPDTYHGQGVYLDLYGSLLVVQAAEHAGEDSPWGILLMNLELPEERRFLALRQPEEFGVALDMPAISGDYAVWVRCVGFFTQALWAQRLVAGRVDGEPFKIGGAGREIAIDRNIVLWNGSIRLEGEEDSRTAIMAAELDLPGADDVGDVDVNGRMDVSDAVAILNHLFLGGWRPRLRLADADGNRKLELVDAVVILQYLFRGGTPPGR